MNRIGIRTQCQKMCNGWVYIYSTKYDAMIINVRWTVLINTRLFCSFDGMLSTQSDQWFKGTSRSIPSCRDRRNPAKLNGSLHKRGGKEGEILITPGWRKGKMQKLVSHPSTNRAKHCLTSVTGRELVLPLGYGLCFDEMSKTGRVEMQSWESWVSWKSGFLEKIRESVPGAFKLGRSQQVEPILFWNFSK